jgi:transcriptional regulator with XRE-family HTH domain
MAGLTQEQAASEVLTFRLLAALERGEGNPTLRTLWMLTERYGLSVRDVIEIGGEKPLKVPLHKAVVEQPPRRRRTKDVVARRKRR